MAGVGTQVHVGGDVVGQLVVGDHNITVWAEQSVVTVVAPADRPRPVRRNVVTLLPRQPRRPVGRDRELAALRHAVETGQFLQVYGPPGTGKSTLVRYAASQLARPGVDVVYLSAAGRAVIDVLQDVFEACYDTAGYRPSPVEMRRLMAGVNVALIIDDLDVAPGLGDELPDAVPNAAVVVTSQRRSTWATGQSWELTGLAWDPAVELLAAALKRPLGEHELLAAAQLWRAAGGSPLLLLRAAANARAGPDGMPALPRAAELDELLPRMVASLTAPTREVVAVLAVAGCAVSTTLLPWLVAAPAELPRAIGELTWRGLATVSEQGCQLMPGVAARLPADLSPGPPQLEWIAGRLRESARLVPPSQMADHVLLITSVIEASVRLGRPDIGALLARATAPIAACSGRLGAWERILDRGRAAAKLADDRPTLAYLTHEDGIRSLVTGNRVAAAASIAAAIALWHELGHTALVAVAQQTQSIVGSAVPATAQTAQMGQATAHGTTTHGTTTHGTTGHGTTGQISGGQPGATPTAAKSTAAAAKAGLGPTAKIAIASVITVAATVGGYAGVDAVRTPDRPAAVATRIPTGPQPTESTESTGPSQPGGTPSTTGSPRKGVLPTDCPTDPYWGSFSGREPWLEKKTGVTMVCSYEKGGWGPLISIFDGTEGSADYPGAQAVQIDGTDSAWVLPPASPGEAGVLLVTIDNRSMKAQFVGTVEQAIDATKRTLGLA